MVEEAKHDAEHHVDDAENNRHLHLERVGVRQFVVSKGPDLARSDRQTNVTELSRGQRQGSMHVKT
jgi:hypothetical protein